MSRLEGKPLKPHTEAIWQFFLKHECKRVLNAGCGFGWVGKHNPRGIEVIGIDLDEAKLKTAKKYEVVVKGDVCHLPFKNSSFDGVLASHILEHVPEDLKAMKEFYRVLREGGILIAESPTPWHGAEVDPTHVRSYVVKSFSDLANKADFQVLRCYLLGKGIPGFGKLRLHSVSYRVGNFLAHRLHVLRGFIFLICRKSGGSKENNFAAKHHSTTLSL